MRYIVRPLLAITLIMLLWFAASCDSLTSGTPPPFATPQQCNSSIIPSAFTACNDVPGATATTSTMFNAPCYICADGAGHTVGYVAQPGDPSGTNDLGCFWNDGVLNRICVAVCVPATQDHRGCPP